MEIRNWQFLNDVIFFRTLSNINSKINKKIYTLTNQQSIYISQEEKQNQEEAEAAQELEWSVTN